MWASKAVGSRATRTQGSSSRASTRSEQHRRYRKLFAEAAAPREGGDGAQALPVPGAWLISLDGHTLLDGSARPRVDY